MAAPSQMFVNTLNPLKGWVSATALDFAGKIDPAVTISPLPAGRCVHVSSITPVTYGPGTSGGQPMFKTGVTGSQMGIFLFQGSLDFDVSNSGTDITGSTLWWAVAPKGISAGLVATGAYELETTEFDTTQVYNPNDVLAAVAADGNATAGTGGGCLTNVCFPYVNAIVGVVSRGAYVNAYGRNALAFWPVYLPADPCHALGEPCAGTQLPQP